MRKCSVCGRRFRLLAKNRYEVVKNPVGFNCLTQGTVYYNAFDCLHCGCQNIVGVFEKVKMRDIEEQTQESEDKKMNRRKELVLAMERLVRSVNDESLLMIWLTYGVPDGDIKNYTVDEVDDSLVEDEEFAILMGMFLRLMSQAEKDGGLYVDHIVSKEWM